MKNRLTTFLMAAFLLGSACLSLAQTQIVLVKKWGEFGDRPGQFKFPTMIAADHHSDIYVVDQHNHRIQKFDSLGNFISMWGSFGNGPGQFNYPYGIAVDSRNNVYVSDMNNNRVQKFSPEGAFLAMVGSYGTEDSQFKYPYGLAVDDKDVLYVIDAFNYQIKKFDSNLRFLSKWGSPELIGIKLYMPHEMAATRSGNIILSDRQNHRLSIFTPDGKLVERFGEYGEGNEVKGGEFSEPHGIAANEKGEILVCDRYNFRIQKFSSQKQFQTQWATSAVFEDSQYFPMGIAVTPGGRVFVTDHYAHTVHLYQFLGSGH